MPGAIFSFVFQFAVLLLVFGALNLIIMFLIRKNVKWPIIITAGMVYFAVIFFGSSALSVKASGNTMMYQITADFNASMDLIAAELKKKGFSAEEIQNVRKYSQEYVIKLLPAWFIVTAVYLVFLNYFVMRLLVLRKYGIKNEIKSFELWYLNESVIWLLIIGLAILAPKFITNKLTVPDQLYTVALNFVFLLLNLYFFIGMGIISFMMKKFKVAPGFQFFVFFAAIFLLQFIVLPIAVTGIFDTWFNFRKIEKGGNIWK